MVEDTTILFKEEVYKPISKAATVKQNKITSKRLEDNTLIEFKISKYLVVKVLII